MVESEHLFLSEGGFVMKNRKGFTLIELLTVIAIIAILSSILFPAFATARAKGRQVSCMSNLRQLGVAMTLYFQDYGDLFPASNWATNEDPPAAPFNVRDGGLFSYVSSEAIYVCMSDPDGARMGLSYEMNSRLMSIPECSARDPSGTVLLLDARVNDSRFVVCDCAEDTAIGAFNPDAEEPPTADVMNAIPLDRADVLFVDGHVSGVHYGQLTTGMFDR